MSTCCQTLLLFATWYKPGHAPEQVRAQAQCMQSLRSTPGVLVVHHLPLIQHRLHEA